MSTPLVLFVCLAIITIVSRGEPLAGHTFTPSAQQFPFIVSIGQNFDTSVDNPLGHVCGGALITIRYVLTAASCFKPDRTKDEYFVYSGNADLAMSTLNFIEELITFDEWLAKRMGRRRGRKCKPLQSYAVNDIAVIKLQEATEFPLYDLKIWEDTPEKLKEELERRNWIVRTGGWTTPLPGDPNPWHMLGANLQMINHDECLRQMGVAPNEKKGYGNFFCTAGVPPEYTVLDIGDKGSPVVLEIKKKTYRVIGINVKSVPDIDGYDYQRNAHIGYQFYTQFLKSTMTLKYLDVTADEV